MRAARYALLAAAAFIAAPAGAVVLPGAPPCPTILNPSPCLIFDTSKLGKLATQVKQEAAKTQRTVQTVQGYKRTGAALGKNLSNTVRGIKAIPGTIAGNALRPITKFEGQISAKRQQLPRAIEAAAKAMVTVPGARPEAKEQVARSTAATAYATAIHTKANHVATAEATMADLASAASAATSLRDDMAVNSRLRLELMRQRLVGDALMATLVQMKSAARSRDQKPVPALPSWTVTKPIVTAKISNAGTLAWLQGFDLAKLSGAASRIAASAKIVEQLRGAQRDLAQLGQMSRAADRARDDAAAALQKFGARSGPRGLAGAQQLVAALNAIPQQYQAAVASGRVSPDVLAAKRGIGAAELAAGVDPMTIVGTWADPLKDEDARATAQRLIKSGAFGKVGDFERPILVNLAVAYQGASLYSNVARTAAADAETTYAQLERTIAATEAARGTDLDGEGWMQVVDRLDAAAQPLEQALTRMPASTAAAIGDDVAADARRLDQASALR